MNTFFKALLLYNAYHAVMCVPVLPTILELPELSTEPPVAFGGNVKLPETLQKDLASLYRLIRKMEIPISKNVKFNTELCTKSGEPKRQIKLKQKLSVTLSCETNIQGTRIVSVYLDSSLKNFKSDKIIGDKFFNLEPLAVMTDLETL